MSDLPALPVTFRPGRTRVILLTAGVLIFVVISGIALLLENLGPGSRLSFIVTGALCLWVLAQLARVKVVADESGVTVVNIASRRRLAWAEILRVNLRPGDPWVFLDLSDGTSLPALGIQPGIAKQQAIADARALRALAEARSGSPALPHEPRS
ncbi:PH domain-containing protein [Streptomyces nogalater]|uniref:PH domain-containing protein n=1 Tax=Streptomyces nogalater TaxID=38314 RepID=A0ABW0WRK0_STRNO